LKLRTYGVKKPIEEKQDKIKQLYDQKNQRYYPVGTKGQLDEWAAVIKHQEEIYKNEVERRRIDKQKQQKQYYDELKKGIEDRKRNQYFERMMHDNDVNVMMDKKVETDFIQRGLQDRQKEDKFMLGQIYQNQIDQSKRLKDSEKLMEKELERMQVEKALSIDPEAYNKLKKKAYQQEIKQELNQKNSMKMYDHAMREHSVRESKKMMDEYAKKEFMNEQNYKNKFNKFDQDLQKRLSEYNNHVMKPSLQKQMNQDMLVRK
jgi:hypothetical protein